MLIARAALALVLVSIPLAASADDKRPCASESAAAAAAGADPALTPPTEAAALEHLEAGNRAFRVQQYDTAIDEYTTAGLKTSAPVVLYNLGQSLRAGKQYGRAIRQYELFLSRGEPGPKMRALVECHIATMKAEMDAAASTAPPSGPAPDSAEPEGATEQTSPEQPTTEHRSRWSGRRKVAVGIAAGGLVAVGAGVAFGLRSRGFKDDAAELCPSSACASPELATQANDLADKADSNALIANVAFGVGGAAIAGAIVLWVLGAPDGESATEVTIVPRATSTSSTVSVGWSF